MSIIPRKTSDTILNEMIESLRARTSITNFSAGSMARTLLEVVNAQLGDLYDALDTNLMQGFVSTASGTYLDYIGTLLSVQRETGESDEDYRYRITRRTLSMAQSNLTAVRLAVLGLPNVNDVVISEYLYGSGSFGLYLITDELVPSSALLQQAQAVVDEVKAFGVYGKVLPAQVGNVDIQLSIIGKSSLNLAGLTSLLRTSIQEQFDQAGAGGTIDLTALARLPYTLSPLVTESRILSLTIDGEVVYDRDAYTLSRITRARLLNLKVNS